MKQQLLSFIENLKSDKRISSFDEAATKQGVVLKLLNLLGWDSFNIDEVTPEYSVGGKRVDYCLRVNKSNKVFIEVKKVSKDLEQDQKQLLNYSFEQGIKLAILTNGITWWLYLPLQEGSWEQRKFYTIDIIEQDTEDIASKFIDFIGKENVTSGDAIQNAETAYESIQKRTALKDALPKAWNKIITEPDELLVELIKETAEKICGYKAENTFIRQFLLKNQDQFLVEESTYKPLEKAVAKTSSINEPDEKVTESHLVSYIVLTLGEMNGRASKKQVEERIFELLRNVFNDVYYHEKVSHGVPRWQHNIAWAKESAKRQGLVKNPQEAGRGYWELSDKGWEYYKKYKGNF